MPSLPCAGPHGRISGNVAGVRNSRRVSNFDSSRPHQRKTLREAIRTRTNPCRLSPEGAPHGRGAPQDACACGLTWGAVSVVETVGTESVTMPSVETLPGPLQQSTGWGDPSSRCRSSKRTCAAVADIACMTGQEVIARATMAIVTRTVGAAAKKGETASEGPKALRARGRAICVPTLQAHEQARHRPAATAPMSRDELHAAHALLCEYDETAPWQAAARRSKRPAHLGDRQPLMARGWRAGARKREPLRTEGMEREPRHEGIMKLGVVHLVGSASRSRQHLEITSAWLKRVCS